MKEKQKLFHSYVRSKQKVKPVMPHLRKEDGETTTNDQEIADVLWKFFESVFTVEEGGDNILLEFGNRVQENKVLNEITFTELDIFIKLQLAVKRRQGLWSRWYTSKDIEGLS